ncbi:sulfatase [Tautonia marina]|uniref:sulfatase n=1 Tax=Tautonia marina TaxID=2653855 RepID=UPI001376497B|nr:sulfatase [Tautonia marina]
MSTERPPNLLLVVIDDLGWSDLGCYGADLHETPHLDRLAEQGGRFSAAYAAPVCTPSRAAIMTGKHPARLHMTVWSEAARQRSSLNNRPLLPPVTRADLPHHERTLAEWLRPAGYLTAHVGKWHLGDSSHYPETQGFDLNVGGTHWGAPPTFFFPYHGRWSNTEEYRYVPGLPWGKPGEYLTDRLTEEALKILEAAGDQPVFLSVNYYAVHTPIEAKPELVAYYQKRRSPDDQHQNPTYAAMVQTVDENVGKLLAGLDRLEIAQNTLVVVVSDNGGYINDYRGVPVTTNHPLRSGKGSLYEGGIRVPLIIRLPGGAANEAVIDTPVTLMDLFPTFLDVAGVAVEPELIEELDGKSLVPLLDDEPSAWAGHDALYWHFPHDYPTTTPVGAIRAGNWKLLEYFEDGRLELYNLARDPGELENLASAQPERTAELHQQLIDWRARVDAQMPEPNPAYLANP